MASQTGTITAVSQTVTVSSIGATTRVGATINGTYSGVELFFEISGDGGTTWFPIALRDGENYRHSSSTGIIPDDTSAIYYADLQSSQGSDFRVRSVDYTSGTANVEVFATTTSVIADPLTGDALIGQQTAANSIPVVLASDVNDVEVEGTVAHDDPDANNPIKIGGKARTTNPAAVADGDRVDATFDDIGRQAIVPHGVRDLIVKQYTNINSTTETTILAAGGAGVFNDVITLVMDTDSNNVTVTIRDSTAGSTVWIAHLANAGQTVIADFGSPLIQATANNNWTAQSSKGSANVEILIQAVQNV